MGATLPWSVKLPITRTSCYLHTCRHNTLNVNTNPPPEADVKSAIKATKNGKATGTDSIHADMLKADMLKADINTSVKILADRLRNIWDKYIIPEDWAKDLIAKVPKKR